MDVQSFYRSSSLNQTPRDGVAFQTLSLSLPQFSLSLSLSLSLASAAGIVSTQPIRGDYYSTHSYDRRFRRLARARPGRHPKKGSGHHPFSTSQTVLFVPVKLSSSSAARLILDALVVVQDFYFNDTHKAPLKREYGEVTRT
jgi:hypothetical protein